MLRLTKPVTRALSMATFLGAIALAGPAAVAADTASTAPGVTAGSATKVDPQDRVEQRIASLHGKLRITAAQETQWAIVAQAMRDNAKSMDALIKERAANAKSMSAVSGIPSF